MTLSTELLSWHRRPPSVRRRAASSSVGPVAFVVHCVHAAETVSWTQAEFYTTFLSSLSLDDCFLFQTFPPGFHFLHTGAKISKRYSSWYILTDLSQTLWWKKVRVLFIWCQPNVMGTCLGNRRFKMWWHFVPLHFKTRVIGFPTFLISDRFYPIWINHICATAWTFHMRVHGKILNWMCNILKAGHRRAKRIPIWDSRSYKLSESLSLLWGQLVQFATFSTIPTIFIQS